GTMSSLNSGKNVTTAEKGEKGVCDNLDEVGWYWMNGGMKNWNGGKNPLICTHPVGQKKPNAWGLYDMHGNVCEWCLNTGSIYSSDSAIDPKEIVKSDFRVTRGGSWYSSPCDCRSADRGQMTSIDQVNIGLGFRLAIIPIQ
ncbi:MAG: SUMF1/EgtB/PvdO family nonheme iron enzyme, partial [Verrucomicrobia bacterium]|nr:SUMF1/EgtB/PvdO family nonheme iron enzyme [Verrucomicrobiota bacterium]